MILREHVRLAPFTTYRLGGPARYFVDAETRECLFAAISFARQVGLKTYILGGGSNVLVSDRGVDGLVIRLPVGSEFTGITPIIPKDMTRWRVGGATPLPRLMQTMAEYGRAGLEDFAGIPGSVGGAVAMNAGTAETGIGSFVTRASGIDEDGCQVDLEGNQLEFAYRKSNLVGLVVTMVELHLPDRAEPAALKEAQRLRRASKAQTQPIDQRSAGCVFKNPADRAAGMLIDKAGCKGLAVGGATVSGLHANFITTDASATAADVLAVAEAMHDAVRKTFGVALELEIKTWGFTPEELDRVTGSNS